MTAGEAAEPPIEEFENIMLQHVEKQSAKQPPSEEEDQELRDLMAKGVDPRGKGGQRFSRSDAAKSEAYKSLRQCAKAQFRLDWAAAEIKTIIRTRQRSQSYQRIDGSHGEYVPFSILWQREGGHRDPFALSAAISHASKCMQMGGPWINMNTMTNRVEFLHLKRIVKEQFSQCWSMYEKAVLGGSADAQGSQGGMACEPPEKKDDDVPKNDDEAKVDERKNNNEKKNV